MKWWRRQELPAYTSSLDIPRFDAGTQVKLYLHIVPVHFGLSSELPSIGRPPRPQIEGKRPSHKQNTLRCCKPPSNAIQRPTLWGTLQAALCIYAPAKNYVIFLKQALISPVNY